LADRAVLFVDDEPNILSTLRRLCRRESFTTLTAGSGPEALEILQQTPAQVIISDYRMPEMTGVEFLSQAKAIIPDSVRIVLSGFADTQAVVEAINKGEVYRFLGKPWDDRELLSTILQSFDHHDLRCHNRELQARLQEQNDQLQRMNERLEDLVHERTHSLTLAQEVLEQLPMSVLGISLEGEVMISNTHFLRHHSESGAIDPGIEIEEVLPADMAAIVRTHLADGQRCCYAGALRGQPVQVIITTLQASGARRGCVLVLQ
jgi:response regulator RpfG family c-di-GMP phosphodiesterase